VGIYDVVQPIVGHQELNPGVQADVVVTMESVPTTQ